MRIDNIHTLISQSHLTISHHKSPVSAAAEVLSGVVWAQIGAKELGPRSFAGGILGARGFYKATFRNRSPHRAAVFLSKIS
jgi:hypothetical protein